MDINEIIALALFLKEKNIIMVAVLNLIFCCLGYQNHMGIVLNGGVDYINSAVEHRGKFHFSMIDFFLRGTRWNTPVEPCPPRTPCIRRIFNPLSNFSEWIDKVGQLLFVIAELEKAGVIVMLLAPGSISTLFAEEFLKENSLKNRLIIIDYLRALGITPFPKCKLLIFLYF